MATDVHGDLLRALAPQVVGALVRRHGRFDAAEDAVQEALLAAATQWPRDGLPADPKGWLVAVAARRLTDLLRSESARRRREDTVTRWTLPADRVAPPADARLTAGDAGTGHHAGGLDADDSLVLLFLCCHPTLTPASQIALTLRAVGGLTTAEIARAFLVGEDTMARRITRAKRSITTSGLPFALPAPHERADRVRAVLHVLYLVFTEGHTATTGAALVRADLTGEAVRLARLVRRLLPGDPEVAGLLALMLLTDARRPARTGPDGALVPMAEQDRSLWDAGLIREGVDLITAALPHGPVGPYQLQAAIAAVHDEAPSSADTDWPQIAGLYETLLRLPGSAANPMTRLNHAVAVGMARGPAAGLALTDGLCDALAADHRLHAVRGHLLERAGDVAGAREAFAHAARRTTSLPQRRHLEAHVARLTAAGPRLTRPVPG